MKTMSGVVEPKLAQAPAFDVEAELLFLKSGDYVFRSHERGKTAKFVTARDVAAAFTQKEDDSGWMPAGVVRSGFLAKGPMFVYSAPAQMVQVTLVNLRPEPFVIEIPAPRTVLLGVGRTYWLWAVKSKIFEADADAFHAPFPNVYGDGKVCWGDTQPPEADAGKSRKIWELFFSTAFNDHLANGKSTTENSDVRRVLVRLAEEGKKKYPEEDLVRHGFTVNGLFIKAAGGGR
jgi:hypothetical protein